MKMNTYPVIVVEFTDRIHSVEVLESDQSDLLNFHTVTIKHDLESKLETRHAKAVSDLLIRSFVDYSDEETSDVDISVDRDTLWEISVDVVGMDILFWSNRILPPFVRAHIQNVMLDVQVVCKYFHGHLAKMYMVESGNCSNAVNEICPCAKCIKKYSSLLRVLDYSSPQKIFSVASRLQKHHVHEAKK